MLLIQARTSGYIRNVSTICITILLAG